MQHGIDLIDAEVFVGTTSPQLMQELIDKHPAFAIYYEGYTKLHDATCNTSLYCFMSLVKDTTKGDTDSLYRIVAVILDESLTIERRMSKAHAIEHKRYHNSGWTDNLEDDEWNTPDVLRSLKAFLIQK